MRDSGTILDVRNVQQPQDYVPEGWIFQEVHLEVPTSRDLRTEAES